MAAGAASGAALVAAFPPVDASRLGWVALVPLFVAVRRAPPLAATMAGLVAGLVFQSALGRWLLPDSMHPLAYALAVLGCSLFPAGFALTAGWQHRRAPAWSGLIFPALWVLFEYARSHFGVGAAPWGMLGYTQLEQPLVARIAAASGVFGVSFAVAAVNAALTWVVDGRLRADGALAVMLALSASVGLSRLGAPAVASMPASLLRVAVVQAGSSDGVPADSAAATALFERYRALTRSAAAQGATLIVWPESSVPAPLPDDREALSNLARLARELRVHLIVSTTGRDKNAPGPSGRRANSAFAFEPTGRLAGRYDKIRLLPFIEYWPARGLVDWPDWLAPAMIDASPGTTRTVFLAEGARFSVQLCWENLFAGELRSLPSDELDFVVSMTNEAFTSAAAGRRQLYQINAMRALETGLPLVRAATTGVSAILGPDGVELARVRDSNGRDLDAVGFALAEVPLRSAPSLYARGGDWLVGAAALLAVAAGLAGRRPMTGDTR